jgi:hypothetical protein
MFVKPAARVRFTMKVQRELYKKGVRHAFDTWIVHKVHQASLLLKSARCDKKKYFLTVEANQALFDL